jgi:hypothetical protein
MTAEEWQRVKAIGSAILVAAACMDYREGKSDVEQREVAAMRDRVRELERLLGMKVRP